MLESRLGFDAPKDGDIPYQPKNSSSEWIRRRRGDIAAISLLLAAVALFLLPELTRSVPLFYDAALEETIPRNIARARALQNGGIPLWDSNTFAGAKPFYTYELGAFFYFPVYPFYLLTNAGDADQVAYMTIVLPHCLHMLWACVGGFLFGRAALRLHSAGAFVMGLLCALTPEMLIGILATEQTFVFSWLPWVMLLLTLYMETGRCKWWILGSIALGVMNSTGHTNFLIRIHVLLGLTALLLWLFTFQKGRGGKTHKEINSPVWRGSGRLLGVVVMLAVGAGLSGHVWAGLIEGASWLVSSFKLTYELATTINPEGSMHPLFLVTLFVPSFLGTLDGRHGWGIAVTNVITNVSALGGGMCGMTAAAVAVGSWFRRKSATEEGLRLKAWTWIAVLGVGFFSLVIMGRYTPVFKGLCLILPPFFRIPHPIYYHFAVCWNLAVLASIGMSSLMTPLESEQRIVRWGPAAVCLLAATGIGAVVLLWPVFFEGSSVPAYQTITIYREWNWFLSNPVLYFLIASACLAILFVVVPQRWRGWGLLLGVSIETVLFAAPVAYISDLYGQMRKPPAYASISAEPRYARLADYWGFQVASKIDASARNEKVRWAGQPCQLDNQAWTLNGRTLLGRSCKPLMPRYIDVFSRVTVGLPYHLHLTTAPVNLFRNMNVGYIVHVADQQIEPRIVRIPLPLPYAYLQDRVVPVDAATQRDRLMWSDLQAAVYVNDGDFSEAPRSQGPGARTDVLPADTSRFDALQRENPVLRVDQSGPNQTIIEADAKSGAMLVIAECWHPGWKATVDGKPTSLRQVNYLQQGVWLKPGHHLIKLTFWPISLTYGLCVTALSGTIVIVVSAIAGARYFRRRRTG